MKNIVIGLAFSVLVTSCASTQSIPVINKSPHRNIPEAYEVKHRDSIYKIAWAFGVDFLDIAEYNDLKEPYQLTPGEILYLRGKPVSTTPLDLEAGDLREPVVVKRLPEKKPVVQFQSDQENAPTVTFSQASDAWNWPAEGKLVGKFSPETGNNGIQISGPEGSPVKATQAGEVVYVGQGLRGYGELVIIKHSEQFLSAYAHNKKILVQEGQAISSGQQIAAMGNTGTRSTMLHFEIRKDGEPVDPLKFLK